MNSCHSFNIFEISAGILTKNIVWKEDDELEHHQNQEYITYGTVASLTVGQKTEPRLKPWTSTGCWLTVPHTARERTVSKKLFVVPWALLKNY